MNNNFSSPIDNSVSSPKLGEVLTISGDITNSCWSSVSPMQGRIDINYESETVCLGMIEHIIKKFFSDRSYTTQESLKNVFYGKTLEQLLNNLTNTFTTQNIEFFETMSDAELINYFRIIT